MTPDPSGAARAPQPLLERVKSETLPECELQAGIAAEMGANGDAAVLLRAAEMLGALVQAVEDQQNERGFQAFRAEEAEAAWTEEKSANLKLEAEVAQLRADGQRLREALDKQCRAHAEVCPSHENCAVLHESRALLAALAGGDAP